MKSSLNTLQTCAESEGKDIPFHYKRSILVDIGQGLQFLHSKDIIHRDLSSNNVLLTKDYVAKIRGDLRLAKVVDPQHTRQKLTQVSGTQAFMPPVALQNDLQYGPPLDVFSLGCVCIHLVSLQWPIPEARTRLDETTGKMMLVTEFQRRQKFLAKFDQSPPELKILVEQCLNDHPKDRPIAGEVVERLKNIKCDPLPHENDDLLQLHTSLIDCEEQLAQCVREKDEELAEKSKYFNEELTRVVQQLADKDQQLAEKDQQLVEKDQELVKKAEQLQKIRLTKKDQLMTHFIQQLKEKVDKLIRDAIEQLADKDQQLADKDQQLAEKDQQLAEEFQQLADKDQQLAEKDQQLVEKDQELVKKAEQLQKIRLTEKDQLMTHFIQQLKEKVDKLIRDAIEQLADKDQQLAEKLKINN